MRTLQAVIESKQLLCHTPRPLPCHTPCHPAHCSVLQPAHTSQATDLSSDLPSHLRHHSLRGDRLSWSSLPHLHCSSSQCPGCTRTHWVKMPLATPGLRNTASLAHSLSSSQYLKLTSSHTPQDTHSITCSGTRTKNHSRAVPYIPFPDRAAVIHTHAPINAQVHTAPAFAPGTPWYSEPSKK